MSLGSHPVPLPPACPAAGHSGGQQGLVEESHYPCLLKADEGGGGGRHCTALLNL